MVAVVCSDAGEGPGGHAGQPTKPIGREIDADIPVTPINRWREFPPPLPFGGDSSPSSGASAREEGGRIPPPSVPSPCEVAMGGLAVTVPGSPEGVVNVSVAWLALL